MHTITPPHARQRLTLLIISAVLAFLLIQATAAQAAPQLPLKTQGSTIVDAAGKEVVLQGVNWFGFETANHAPHGLWTRDYIEMLAQIKAQGFNTIRMPFSLQMLDSTTTSGIDYGNGNNAALQGKTPQQVMDIIIAEAGRQDLMIILDNHSTTDDSFMHPLWYGLGGYTEDNWVAAWTKLAARYANTPNVIGADLKNEPHGEATWGTGAANDWRRAAERGRQRRPDQRTKLADPRRRHRRTRRRRKPTRPPLVGRQPRRRTQQPRPPLRRQPRSSTRPTSTAPASSPSPGSPTPTWRQSSLTVGRKASATSKTKASHQS